LSKADIVEWIVKNKNINIPKKDVFKIVDAIFKIIIREIENSKNGNKIQISGFGTFHIKKRAPKIGRNPKTKEEKVIPERLGVSFKAGKVLERRLNKTEIGA